MVEQQQTEIPIISVKSPLLSIECKDAFNNLTKQEKLYSFYFARASWEGSKICYFQRSYESPAMFYILQKIFKIQPVNEIENLLKSNQFSDQEIQQIFVYVAAFFQNCGNYKSFGDTKFIPELHQEKFKKFIQLTLAYQSQVKLFDEIWSHISLEIYSYENPYKLIEMSDSNGHSSYYSSNITKDEAEQIDKYLAELDISPLNTRVIKHGDGQFEVLVASVSKYLSEKQKQSQQKNKKLFNNKEIKITYGDFSSILSEVNKYLQKCLVYAANQNQQLMILNYISHFDQGSVDLHKESQRWWIKDKGPAVETNLGFIESYLDPLKVRAEFEGFVSIVNKQESVKLKNLVNNAENLISNLPWGKAFEIEKFSSPDFTSLEILAFACSGTPVGINIPNYDDIRQNEGFKNVNLGNVYGTPDRKNAMFISESDKDFFCKYYKESLFLVVALHELLGHGTGKLFQSDINNVLNFDANIKNPFTNEPITTYYKHNENWHGKFGDISSGYEECRADGVALFLSCCQESLSILLPEYNQQAQNDIVFTAWLDMAYGAIRGLEYYDEANQKWGQAHIRAAYALLKVMLNAGNNFLQVKILKNEQGNQETLQVILDRSQIWTTGKKAVGDFLYKLQVYKSIGDVKEGTQFFEEQTKVSALELTWRKIAIANKQPRKIELQHEVNLVGDDEDVTYEMFNPQDGFKSVINSQIAHHRGSVENVIKIWNENSRFFRIQ